MSPCCPTCGRDGVWNGQSGMSSGDTQQLEDRFRDSAGHQWTVTR